MKKLVLLDTENLEQLKTLVFDIKMICTKMDYLHEQLEKLGIPLSNELLKEFEAPEQNE